jgi:hypothetical protein
VHQRGVAGQWVAMVAPVTQSGEATEEWAVHRVRVRDGPSSRVSTATTASVARVGRPLSARGRRAVRLLREGLEHEAARPRPFGVYFGSAADVVPVLELSEYNWVFITPEPSHPVAIESWPEQTCGWCLGYTDPNHFANMFLDRLGREDWFGPIRTTDVWYFFHKHTLGRVLRVVINSTDVDLPPSAARLCSRATGVYVMGFCPDIPTFTRLCPRVEHCWGPSNPGMHLDQYADTVTIVPEGDWKPEDGEDFEAKSPRGWIFEAYPDIENTTPEHRDALIAGYTL